MNYSENAKPKPYAEYSWELTAIILRRSCLEWALCLSTWSVRRAPEEGWAASPHTGFLAADLRAGANTEFGPGIPVQRQLLCLSSTTRPWTASRLRPSRCRPFPSHGAGQEAAVAGSPRALLKASQARPGRGIPAEERAAR